jgi:Mn-containing catalase
MHNKRLMYTVRVGAPDPRLAALLYGGGVALANSAGVPWTAAYVDPRTEPTADLRSNIAAEPRIAEHLDSTVRRFGERSAAGQTAGV